MAQIELPNIRLWNPVIVCPQCGGFLNLHNSHVCFNCGYIYVFDKIKTSEIESSNKLFENSSEYAAELKERLEISLLEPKDVINATKSYQKGIEYGRKGDYTSALKELRNAVKYNKFHLNTRIALGIVLAKIKRYSEAKEEWVIALEIDPENELVKKYLKRLDRKL